MLFLFVAKIPLLNTDCMNNNDDKQTGTMWKMIFLVMLTVSNVSVFFA